MRVTSIKNTNKGNLFNIFVDHKLIGQLSLLDIRELDIHQDQVIDEVTYQALIDRAQYNQFYLQALKYADIRLRSKYEMKKFLSSKCCKQSFSEQIILKLEELNVINEQQYVKAYIHDIQLAKPLSRNLILAKLKNKHISPKEIDLALDQVNVDDSQALDALIEKKVKSSTYANNNLKLFNYLLRQGFSYQDIVDRLGLPSKLSGGRSGGRTFS